MTDLTRSEDPETQMFRKYSIALRLWSRRFNTAEIAAHLKEPEHIVQRWIWHWRELSRSEIKGGGDVKAVQSDTEPLAHGLRSPMPLAR